LTPAHIRLASSAAASPDSFPPTQPLKKSPADMAKKSSSSALHRHRVVSREKWLAARTVLLAKEKAFTHARERLAAARRALPWVKIDKEYFFDGPDGRETLADLFAGRSQLAIYHFMFGPRDQAGCASCSFWADNFDPVIVHLNQRDVTMLAVSRAPLKKLAKFQARMGWGFKWVSSHGSDFNFDFNVSFTDAQVRSGRQFYNYRLGPAYCADREGVSTFYKNGSGEIFHTYACFARGIDMLNTAYQYLDLVPKGRDELPDRPQSWVDYHDRYK
jgi:predicted dithiol-disulfide oxidoreductase (DUF899 family)